MAEVKVVAAHAPAFGRTRGRGVSGGWRWTVCCSCGWNRRDRRDQWGARPLWIPSYRSEPEAEHAFVEHLEVGDGPGYFEVRVACPGQGRQRPFIRL